jgi:hypothetical protein
VRAATFRLLLEKGGSVPVASVAAATHLDADTVRRVFDGFATTGNIKLHGGNVIGIAGLSVEATRHRIELAGGARWTWCALDAIGIVGAIGDGVIHSDIDNGCVRLEVRGGEIEVNDLVVLVPDSYGLTSSVDQWCPLANFFPTAEAATAWAERNQVNGQAIHMTAIAPQLIERWSALLDHHQSQ